MPHDTEVPVIHDVQLGATAIDVSAGPVAVPVRARVTDGGGSGLASVQVLVAVRDDPSGGRWSPGRESYTADLVPAEGDWWAGSIVVGQWDGYESPWAVHQVSGWDGDGNYGQRTFLDFFGDRTTSPSFTIAPHPADHEQPYLEELVLDRRVVDVRRRSADIRVAARVSDKGGAGVAAVTVAGTALVRSSGTAQDGWWGGLIRVPRWTRDGYHRVQVVMADAAYNGTWTDVEGLRARGMPWRYRARSVTDAAPPVLLAERLSPTTVDIGSANGALVVAVRLVDVRSGVAAVTATLGNGYGAVTGFTVRLTLRRGSPRDGYWRGTLNLPQCGVMAGRYRVMLTFQDRIGNQVQRTARPVVTVVTDRPRVPPDQPAVVT